MRHLLICFVLLFPFLAQAQGSDLANPERLSPEVYLASVLEHHPIARQAALLSPLAAAQLMQARGAFDPKLYGSWDTKTFDDKQYFSYATGAIKIPTWVGVDITAGWQMNDGTRLNPESYTPGSGLMKGGISVNLGRGLLMDERRLGVRTAEVMVDMREADRMKELTSLVFKARKAYWDWWAAYAVFQRYQEGLELAEFRARAVRARVELGDMAAVDTLEATIEVHKRRFALQEAGLQLQQARLIAGLYLWTMDGRPVTIPEDVVPYAQDTSAVAMSMEETRAVQDSAQLRHPMLLGLDLKMDQLALKRRYAQQMMLPELQVTYQPLEAVPDGSGGYGTGLDGQQLTAGISMPLFLRKERGKLEEVNIQREQLGWEQEWTRHTIATQLGQAVAQVNGLSSMIGTQGMLAEETRRLRDAEETKFEAGESNLFIINRRERSMIEAEIKLIELHAKYEGARAQVLYEAGLLDEPQ